MLLLLLLLLLSPHNPSSQKFEDQGRRRERTHQTMIVYLGLAVVAVVLNFGAIVCGDNHHVNTEAMNFLQQYGYIDNPPGPAENYRSSEELRNSIRLMQRYAHLPETGTIDEWTLAKIKSPRCGLPDVSPGQTSIEQSSGPRRSKRFVTYGPGIKWKKNFITWSLVKPSRNVPESVAKVAIEKAFKLWEEGSQDILKFIGIESDEADIKLGFYVREHGCGKNQAFDGPGAKLAHAFSPPKGDIHFDDEEDWLSQADGLDLYWTTLHEIGHALGFAHTSDERSIMFPYYQDHGDKFRLPDYDRAGIRYLYGNNNNGQQPNKDNKLPLPPKEATRASETTTTTTTGPKVVDKNDPCDTNIDAIASIRGNIFIFKNNVFWWLRDNLELMRNEPVPVSQYFIGFPANITKVDAVYERRSDNMIMFFAGKHYWLFSANQYYAGPRPLTDLGLPYDLDEVDAVTDWANNGKAYIFAGSIYWKLDDSETRVRDGYPQDIGWLRSIPIKMDAAFTWPYDSATYFFKGTQFWRVTHNTKSDEDPRPIHEVWFRSLNCSRLANTDFLYQRRPAVRSSGAEQQLHHRHHQLLTLLVVLFHVLLVSIK